MTAAQTFPPDDKRGLIGRRIRRRRLFLKQTQAGLAKSLGITYQQLQKYENGLNRVPDDRLREIACLLGVSPGYFSTEKLFAAAHAANALESFVESPDGAQLNRAVAGLSGPARARLILAVAAYCDSHAASSDPLVAWLKSVGDKRGVAEIARETEARIKATKVEIAKLLGKTLRTRKMTQLFAAQILRSDQARISTLSRGDVRGVSLEKLLRFLVLLGWDIGIQIAGRPVEEEAKLAITARES